MFSTIISKFFSAPYYVGIAAGNDNFPRQQEISRWIWESRNMVTEFNMNSSRITTVDGAALEDNTRLLLTADNLGSLIGLAVLRDSMVLTQQQFTTKFRWTVLGCDPVYKGGEGYASCRNF